MDRKTLLYLFVWMALMPGFPLAACAQEDPVLFLDRANARVAKATAFKNHWDGPLTGPKITKKGLIVFIGSDFRHGGVAGVANGVKEAVTAIGWNLQLLDCYGIADRRAESFSRAMALKPDGIILAGIDAQEQVKELRAAATQKIPVVGWHAAATVSAAEGLFVNIGTDPVQAGQLAALLAVTDSQGKAGVVILADPSSPYALAKANAIAKTVRQCASCSLLAIEQIPPADVEGRAVRMGALAKRHGTRWTHVIATQDQYFDQPVAAVRPLRLQGIAAGDGWVAAYQRIRDKGMQSGTIAEPLNLQGWQLVDEINRAISGARPSGYAPSPYLVTSQNIAFHGGPGNRFDPTNDYRAAYKRIWGK